MECVENESEDSASKYELRILIFGNKMTVFSSYCNNFEKLVGKFLLYRGKIKNLPWENFSCV